MAKTRSILLITTFRRETPKIQRNNVILTTSDLFACTSVALISAFPINYKYKLDLDNVKIACSPSA